MLPKSRMGWLYKPSRSIFRDPLSKARARQELDHPLGGVEQVWEPQCSGDIAVTLDDVKEYGLTTV